MIISKKLLDEIMYKLPKKPPETGGIMGGYNQQITAYWIDDVTNRNERMCSYVPNVEKINQIIKQWEMNGIKFFGMFHTHYFSVKTLSCGDIKYMKKIIDVMPEFVNTLFFPIFVYPDEEMILYKIEKKTKEIAEIDFKLI